MNDMTSLRDCGNDVYCRRFLYFLPHSDTFRSAKFQWNPDILKDLLHLEEDFGDGEWRLNNWHVYEGQAVVCCTPTIQALCLNQRKTLQR